MAMKFNDAELQRAFAEHIRPAVQQTGYELRAANHEGQPAGPIDEPGDHHPGFRQQQVRSCVSQLVRQLRKLLSVDGLERGNLR